MGNLPLLIYMGVLMTHLRGWSLTAGAVGGSWPRTQSITHTTKQTHVSYRLGKSIKHRLTRFRGFSVSYQIYNSPVLVFVV